MHDTYDRFLGSWWGGIIGQSFARPLNSFEDLLIQPWFQKRSQIAQILLEHPSEPNNSLTPLIESLQTKPSNITPQHNSKLLSLLPLIIFEGERQDFTLSSFTEGNLKSVNLVKDSYHSPNVLLWSYLLTTVLNSQANLSNQKLTETTIFNYRQIAESAVVKKLKLVEEAREQGITFESLKARLSVINGLPSTAIALSWYCFVSTPYEPKLSIQRAARAEQNLSWLTAALTGTLSGAYNGMARISVNWRIDEEVNLQERREQHLFSLLFKSWLGIYAPDLDADLWEREISAVATGRSIQLRPSLKIISQLS